MKDLFTNIASSRSPGVHSNDHAMAKLKSQRSGAVIHINGYPPITAAGFQKR